MRFGTLFVCGALFACGGPDALDRLDDQGGSLNSGTFGQTGIGTVMKGSSVDVKRASPFSLAVGNVTVSKLTAYIDAKGVTSGSQTLKGVIYANSNGLPGALLCKTNEVVVPASTAAAAWKDLPISGTCTLATAGTYFLGMHTGGPTAGLARYAVSTVTNALQYNNDAYADGPANPWGTYNPVESSQISIYATYTVGDGTPPTVSWQTPTANQTVSGTLSEDNGNCIVVASDNQGVDHVDFFLDNVLLNTEFYAAYACLWDTTKSTNGAHTLKAVAYDAAGNSASASVTVTVSNGDSTKPTEPTGLAASSIGQTSLTLTWNASTDNVGVTGYDVYRNGTKVATVTGTSSSQTGLTCGTSYAFAVAAKDAAGNTSAQATLNAQTSACSGGGGCQVDTATMTAPGCRLLRDDTSAVSDPNPGMWGRVDVVDMSRYGYHTSGGDPRPRADGSAQGNSAYRSLTVQYGDEKLWDNNARAEMGRNEHRYGENTGSQTSGTFALFYEGEHKIIFWSNRFESNFDFNQGNWQVFMQAKQAEPYAANGPNNGGPAIVVHGRSSKLWLSGHNTTDYWTTTAPPLNTWIRFAMDVVWSKDPAKGRLRLYVDRNGDGDFNDAGEISPVFNVATLAYATTAGYGLNVGDPIPGHLRLGVYHNPVIPTCTVDVDNVQIMGQ